MGTVETKSFDVNLLNESSPKVVAQIGELVPDIDQGVVQGFVERIVNSVDHDLLLATRRLGDGRIAGVVTVNRTVSLLTGDKYQLEDLTIAPGEDPSEVGSAIKEGVRALGDEEDVDLFKADVPDSEISGGMATFRHWGVPQNLTVMAGHL
jgi:hypothetical protein